MKTPGTPNNKDLRERKVCGQYEILAETLKIYEYGTIPDDILKFTPIIIIVLKSISRKNIIDNLSPIVESDRLGKSNGNTKSSICNPNTRTGMQIS